MTTADPGHEAAAAPPGFAERLLEVIDAGRRTATYKLALLMALIDLCARNSGEDGCAPSVLYTRDIAGQVAAIYWPQVIACRRRLQRRQKRPAARRSPRSPMVSA